MEVGNPQRFESKKRYLKVFKRLKLVQMCFIFEIESRYAALLRGMQHELIVVSQCSKCPFRTKR